jgi:HK97 family phage prohead protease
MTTTAERAAAAAARRAAFEDKAGGPIARSAGPNGPAVGSQLRSVPIGVQRSVPFASQMRAEVVTRDGKEFNRVSGYASAFGEEHSYEMYDFFGPYDEFVAVGAADATLAANPDTVFLVNHKGLSMARTTAGTLELSADDHGLHQVSYLNPQRTDVRDLVIAIEDGTITEQSFAFRIDEGWWNDDFTRFQIVAFDIDRGDVSAVNYGANPHTDIAARQRDLFSELSMMPAYAARGAMLHLRSRSDLLDDLGAERVAEVEARRQSVPAASDDPGMAARRMAEAMLAEAEG